MPARRNKRPVGRVAKGKGDGEPLESPDPKRSVRILVVDDHVVTRLGVVSLLEEQPEFEVVGEAGSCRECREKAAALKPDLVILDLEMGDCGGVEAIEQLEEAAPEARVVIFTAHVNHRLVSEVIGTGALGYVPKSASPRHLVDAVRTVCAGGAYLEPSVSSLVIGKLSRRNGRTSQTELSVRESSVLRLLAEGKRNKEIADALFITERTVKFHVSALMQKLDAGNRTEAVNIAREAGLVGG
jgi:NarL family two-component system response regulator LiaR